jgi:hypothetical protein
MISSIREKIKYLPFIKKTKIWDRLSQIVIFSFLFIGSIYAFQKGHFWGEADSYIIATIAIQQHGSLDIREGDIRQLELERYPAELVDRVKDRFERGIHYPIDLYGKRYPWYMGTYSIGVLPVKVINYVFNLPQTYSYQLSNVLYYSLALLVVYFCFKQTRKNVFLTILLLTCSPTFVYIIWASAEIFICSLLIVSLVFLINGNRHLAALFMSVASTLNITICGFALFIIADYFISIYSVERGSIEKGILANVFKQNLKKTIGLAFCFFPALVTPLWSLYHYHLISPMISENSSELIFTSFWVKRFFAYFFDLNIGFLPYYPILLILFFTTILLGIYKKKRQIIILTLGFFILVFLYSAMPHINSGATAISRYNSWSVPFLVFIVISQINMLFKNVKVQRVIVLSLIISASTTFMITKKTMSYNDGIYVYFTPVARFFLDKFPALYNPYPFTFISRNEHYSGGYDINANSPFIYYSKNGYVKKILIPPECDEPTVFFDLNLSAANDTDMNWLMEQARNIKSKHGKDWAYINIPTRRKITGVPILGVKYWLNTSGKPEDMEAEISRSTTHIEGLSFDLASATQYHQFYSELVSIKPDSYYFVTLNYDTLQKEDGIFFVDLYDTISDSSDRKYLNLNNKHAELLLYSGRQESFLGDQYFRVVSYNLNEPVKVSQLSLYELEYDKASNSVYFPFYNRWEKLEDIIERFSGTTTLIEGLSFELASSVDNVQVYSELVSIKPDSYYFVALDYNTLQKKDGIFFVDLYDTISDSSDRKYLDLSNKHAELILYSGSPESFLGNQYLRIVSSNLNESVKVSYLKLYELKYDKTTNSVYIPSHNRWARPGL